MPKESSMPLYAVALAILVSFCWGGNYSASKFALADMPPFLVVLLRFVCVSLLLAPIALRQRPWPRMRDMAFLSVTLIVLQFAIIFIAMKLGLTIASVIVATQLGVPFSCMASAVLYKDYLGPWRTLGLVVAFFGVLIVALTPNASAHWVAFIMATFAAMAWSVATIYMKRLGAMPVATTLFWPGLLSLPMLLVLTLLFEEGQVASIEAAHWTAWAGIAYSTVFSSLVGYGLWNWLIGRYPVSQVVPYSLCMPIAGISGGVIFFNEQLTAQIVLGAVLTVVGVGIISLRRPKLVAPE